jgi:hypothetical protein
MNIAFDNVCFKGSIVSPRARFVYMCLCKHADSTHQTCFPSLNRIAEIVGKSISTVKRAVRELCKYGAIERNPRFRKDGGQTSNLYKVAQVDLGSLTEVSDNGVNEETRPEQKENQDTASENIYLSESNKDNEAAQACTSIDSKIGQENNQIEESIVNEIESDIQSMDINSESEFEDLHICSVPTKQHNIEIDAIINRSPIIKSNEDENINSEPMPTSKFNVLHTVKKSVLKLVKTISTKVSPCKIHIFRHNELGGGHRWPPKNLSN